MSHFTYDPDKMYEDDNGWVELPNGVKLTRDVYRKYIHWKYMRKLRMRPVRPHRFEKFVLYFIEGNPFKTLRNRIQKATRK